MSKIKITGTQLTTIKKYIKESQLDPESNAILQDILGTVSEGESIMDKIRSYASRGLLNTAIIPALMLTPKLTTAQKQEVKELTNTETTAETNTDSLTTKQMDDWNDFVKYLRSIGLSGSDKLNNLTFSKKVTDEYKQQHPETTISYDDVIKVQKAVRAYRNWCITMTQQGKLKPIANIKPDYSNFMPWVLGTKDDGILGSYTSQFMFPKYYVHNIISKQTKTVGYANKQQNK